MKNKGCNTIPKQVSPDNRTVNQIDHTLINKKFRTSVKDTRVYRGADISSDHYLVKTSIKLKLRRNNKDVQKRAKYDVDKLKEEDIRMQFSIKLNNRFEILEDEHEENNGNIDLIEKMNNDFENAYNETAKEILGFKKKQTKPWISKESWNLIAQRKQINQNLNSAKSERMKLNLKNKYKEKDKEVKKQIKMDKKTWIESIAKEAEEAASKHHTKHYTI